ncbi:exosome complex protein Rrp42 [Candidatus Bathyarchaeota archaeon]|nr:exosome complex protein Rrp42 [Candidatus Bathyarchaeota archaeon]
MSVTRETEVIAKIKQKQITDLISRGRRLDGRSLFDYREIKVETGVIEKAEGSASVSLGDTKILAGVKIEIGEPFPDTPDEGVLTVNAELVPLASATFELGPPDENAIELARVVDRGLRESKTIDLKKLCINPGKKVFVVFIDIYVLDHDGNLTDASAIAALAALINAKMPTYEIKAGEVELKPEYIQLPLQNYPFTVTMAKIGNKLVVDPIIEEEQVMDAQITVTTDQNGNICAMQKSGPKAFSITHVLEAVDLAREKAKHIRAILGV